MLTVTVDGLYHLECLALVDVWPADAFQVLSGDFRGLEVLGRYSEYPIILTTEIIRSALMVTMVGMYMIMLNITNLSFVSQMLPMET